MFTGIIQIIGHINHIQALNYPNYSGVQLTVHADTQFMFNVTLGDSIAIQGACMTATQLCYQNNTVIGFKADVSHESLSKTVGLNRCGLVNLEKSLCLSTPLGGHLVTGHVDGLGQIKHLQAIGESWQLTVMTPLSMAKFFAIKGSAVINGVSLTINHVNDHETGCDLIFNLIPYTWQHTTLSQLKIDDLVNIEIDLIARYLERMIAINTSHVK